MISRGGWIKVHRKIEDSPVFQNGEVLKLWIKILCRVVYKPTQTVVNNQVVNLQPGEYAMRKRLFADDLGISRNTLNTRLALLKRLGCITMSPQSRYTLVKVLKWKDHQGDFPDADFPKNPAENRAMERDIERDLERDSERDIDRDLDPHNKKIQEAKKGRRKEDKKHTRRSPPEEAECEPEGKPRNRYDEIFEAWWAHYPRKSGKEAASKAYARAAREVGHDRLLEAAKQFAQSDRGKGELRYIPYPATWLNAGHYQDDPRVWSHDATPADDTPEEPQEKMFPVLSDPIEEPGRTIMVPKSEVRARVMHTSKQMADHLRTCERLYCRVCEVKYMEDFRAYAVEKYGEEKCGFKTHILERRRQAQEVAAT